MSELNYKTTSRILNAISSESALKILFILRKDGEICVSDITKKMGLSMSAISHQLQRMEAVGLIDSKRVGRTICYSLEKNTLNKELGECIARLLSKKAGNENQQK